MEIKRKREMYAKKNKQWLKTSIFLLLLLLIAYKFRDYLMEGFREIGKVNTGKKVGVLAASTGYMFAEGAIISQLAKVFHTNITWRNGIACAYYCSFFRGITVGSGAGVAQIYYLSKNGMKPAYATDISVIQYLIQKITLTFLGSMSLLLFFQRVEEYVGNYRNYIGYAIGAAVFLIAAFLLLLLSDKIASLVFQLLDWIGQKRESWKNPLEEVKEQISFGRDGGKIILQSKRKLTEVFLLNGMKYFCWFSIPFVLYGDESALALLESEILSAITTVMSSVVPVPGGYGSLEFMQILLFKPILGKNRVMSFVILYRIATTLFPMFVGGFISLLSGRAGNRKKEE